MGVRYKAAWRWFRDGALQGPSWVGKQEAHLGSRNNQNFVSVPHVRFIEMLTYKAALVGIQDLVTEESYTGQASFLDADSLPFYDPARPRPSSVASE
jgi:transposase